LPVIKGKKKEPATINDKAGKIKSPVFKT